MVPVVILNPSKPRQMKRRRRSRRRTHHRARRRSYARRRNPSIPLKGLGLAFLGGAALGAARYAGEMSGLSQGALGGITLGVGAGTGALVSMASPMAGAGIAGAGAGLGARDLLGAFVALPASGSSSSSTKSMGRVIDSAQLGRVIDARLAELQASRAGGGVPMNARFRRAS